MGRYGRFSRPVHGMVHYSVAVGLRAVKVVMHLDLVGRNPTRPTRGISSGRARKMSRHLPMCVFGVALNYDIAAAQLDLAIDMEVQF
jgi:hypothetical protein